MTPRTLLAYGLVVLALAAGVTASGEAARARVASSLARAQLSRLSVLAGLRETQYGRVLRAGGLPVRATVEGGGAPDHALEVALDADGAFDARMTLTNDAAIPGMQQGSRRATLTERRVEVGPAVFIDLSLGRANRARGDVWELGTTSPLGALAAPWLAALAWGLGCLYLRRGRPVLAAALAGVVAQVLYWCVAAWYAGGVMAPPEALEHLRGLGVREWLLRASSVDSSWMYALVAVTLTGLALNLIRGRQQTQTQASASAVAGGGDSVVGPLLASLGVLAWLDVATRVGLDGPWLDASVAVTWGAMGTAAIACWRARERGHPTDAAPGGAA